jgi:hypothetical protein
MPSPSAMPATAPDEPLPMPMHSQPPPIHPPPVHPPTVKPPPVQPPSPTRSHFIASPPHSPFHEGQKLSSFVGL